MLKHGKTSSSIVGKKLYGKSQPQLHSQTLPCILTQHRIQPKPQSSQPSLQTRQKNISQLAPAKASPTMEAPSEFKAGQDGSSSRVKKNCGITKGVGVHDVVTATGRRIPIQMDQEQKISKTIKANSWFSSEIGSLTRKHAPLIVESWKKVSAEDKKNIITSLTTKFAFDQNDEDLRERIEAKMSKSYGRWRSKLHKHFEAHPDDLDYAQSHLPLKKLWGKSKMAEWEWLCDHLFTKEEYQCR